MGDLESANRSETRMLCLIWIVPHYACLFSSISSPDFSRSFIALIYHYYSSPIYESLSLLWLVHPFVSFIHYHDNTESSESPFWIFPLVHKTGNSLSILWLFHPRATLAYFSHNFSYIALLYYKKRSGSETKYAYFYLIMPQARLAHRAHDNGSSSFWIVFLLLWTRSGQCSELSVGWVYNGTTSLIRHKHDSSDDSTKFHLLLLVWFLNAPSKFEWALGWFFHYKIAILYFGYDYGSTTFRFLYRFLFISIKTNSTRFELNPLFFYKSSPSSRKWYVLGGLIGHDSKHIHCMWCCIC